MRQQIRWLADGQRLHLQDGPIDLVIGAFGRPDAIRAAHEAAAHAFHGLLDALCSELPILRRPVRPGSERPQGGVARRMVAAVAPHAADAFITPMAAVAGAVADHVLQAMAGAASLSRAYVNNGGDIALHLSADTSFRIGMVDRPDLPGLFGHVELDGASPVRGIATSGWRGRSYSLGIADAVTILAATAAQADAAATMVANAVDLPNHPGILRVAACDLLPDSDLGGRCVTRGVPDLAPRDVALALAAGAERADELIGRGLIRAAALHLQGETRTLGDGPPRAAAARTVLARIAAHV